MDVPDALVKLTVIMQLDESLFSSSKSSEGCSSALNFSIISEENLYVLYAFILSFLCLLEGSHSGMSIADGNHL